MAHVDGNGAALGISLCRVEFIFDISRSCHAAGPDRRIPPIAPQPKFFLALVEQIRAGILAALDSFGRQNAPSRCRCFALAFIVARLARRDVLGFSSQIPLSLVLTDELQPHNRQWPSPPSSDC
ncbi:hypothetical protein SAMN05414138_10213 [Rhodoplanes sp. JGI PP 4-B12]|uniref:hypothetical protein n=1 Tax=Rhodoplanes sp. JGI PP 4-B12 TaxID=1873883 RepID=UPI000B50D5FD|nr:hypothetical protein [Rhodoplanes sp. JGI PP 4-B12]SNB54118.1 hypothetical protein SAMN05414138_10213 [Rhodoplanes sp. JGI PP 4-B12]